MTVPEIRPDYVGAYALAGKRHYFGITNAEIERASFAIAQIFSTFKFEPGGSLLTLSTVPEIVQFGPVERAGQILGLYSLNAEDSLYDAARAEAITRQFAPRGIVGVSSRVLDGLRGLSLDPGKVFAGRTVWARPDAYAALKATAEVDTRRVVLLGPMLAMECAQGGLHYDSSEWRIEAKGGALHVSSRSARAQTVEDLDVQIAGCLGSSACSCGARSALLQIED